MAPRGLNVWVNIGAKVGPSVNAAANAVTRRFGAMGRTLRLQSAEMKASALMMHRAERDMAAMFVGYGAGRGLLGMVKAGGAWQHEISMLRSSGRTVQEVAEGIAQSHRTVTELPTARLTENLKILNETVGAYGNFHHAVENLSFNSKFAYMMDNMLGEKAGDRAEMLQNLVQALEIRGSAMDSKRYQQEAGELYRAMVFFRGRFNAHEMRAFAATGNIPLKQYDQRFMTRILPSMITEQGGGDTVGTQATAFFNQILGRVPIGGKALVAEWVKMGLVPQLGTAGNLSRVGWTAGTMKGTDLAMRDPFAWMEGVFLPALKAKGVNTENSKALTIQVSKMFGRETARRFAIMLADPLQRQRLHKDEDYINKTRNLNSGYKYMLATDPIAAQAAAMASIDNLATTMGKAITPEVISALQSFAKAVNYVAGVFERHPALAKGFAALLAGLVGLAAIRFAAMTFGFLGIGRAVGMLGGGLRMLGALPWARLGFTMFRGLLTIAPLLLRGLGVAFGVLSGPIGWALLAASAAALAWRFRKEIAQAWHVVVEGMSSLGSRMWNALLAIDWGRLGMAIADRLTFGLASKVPWLIGQVGAGWHGGVGGFDASRRTAATPVLPTAPGAPYPGWGAVMAAANTNAPAAANSNVTGPVTINVNGAQDPGLVAREVEKKLQKMAAGQRGGLHD